MLARVLSAAVVGLCAIPVEVEVDIASQGLPNFFIVGLPDKAVEEAKERVRSALRNSGADFPARRITVNLAPADLPKEGPAYDLPIALGILLASGQLQANIAGALFAGELSLDGRVRPITGVLLKAILSKEKALKQLFVPEANAKEAAIVPGIDIYSVTSLLSLFQHFTNQKSLSHVETITYSNDIEEEFEFDMKDIKGQELAKRALEIAAAGGHNLLFKGPPGGGKTLLARTLASILPKLTFEEMVEVTKIYSVAGLLGKEAIVRRRPFRAPHHTTSLVGLVGGGTNPRPGEITLAHRGVLFLDEFPEFPRYILESLRQPIEDSIVSISRAKGKMLFPAKCMLIAAQNPCPCGYYQDSARHCTCTAAQVLKYHKRISGPLLDRIDIHIDVPAVKVEKLTDADGSLAENSAIVGERVQKARDIQTRRFEGTTLTSNSELTSKTIKKYCILSAECLSLLRKVVTTLHLSGRSYFRTIKVGRTIADLEGAVDIKPYHVAEALQYRPKLNI
jgi:magnesium chelatase family protein